YLCRRPFLVRAGCGGGIDRCCSVNGSAHGARSSRGATASGHRDVETIPIPGFPLLVTPSSPHCFLRSPRPDEKRAKPAPVALARASLKPLHLPLDFLGPVLNLLSATLDILAGPGYGVAPRDRAQPAQHN